MTDITARGMASEARELVDTINGNLSSKDSEWATWTPTLTWATATPTNVVTTAKYKQIGRMVFFQIKITATDGKGANGLDITPPVNPTPNNLTPYYYNNVITGGSSNSNRFVFMWDDGTHNYLHYGYFGTATSGQSLTVSISGFYETLYSDYDLDSPGADAEITQLLGALTTDDAAWEV